MIVWLAWGQYVLKGLKVLSIRQTWCGILWIRLGCRQDHTEWFGRDIHIRLKSKAKGLGLGCLLTPGLRKNIDTKIYIYSEIQHTYKHSYKAAISAQIQCFYFIHTHYDHTFSKLANHQIRHQATHKMGCQPSDYIWSLQSSSGEGGGYRYVWVNILTSSHLRVKTKGKTRQVFPRSVWKSMTLFMNSLITLAPQMLSIWYNKCP